MKETLTLAGSIGVKESLAETSVIVNLAYGDIPGWVQSLEALYAGATDRMTVTGRGSPHQLHLSRAQSNRLPHQAEWRLPIYTLELTRLELERWIHFARSALRESGADVDHIDLEAVSRHLTGRPSMVTVKVPFAREPVSAAAARAMLGLAPEPS
ncbi:MAG TPA: hypothetical protein VGO40_24705 [Longimicrobium sp.]|jgi:hypothetical protein|nr:hypothetical protein [Longimicrobium sp.]